MVAGYGGRFCGIVPSQIRCIRDEGIIAIFPFAFIAPEVGDKHFNWKPILAYRRFLCGCVICLVVEGQRFRLSKDIDCRRKLWKRQRIRVYLTGARHIEYIPQQMSWWWRLWKAAVRLAKAVFESAFRKSLSAFRRIDIVIDTGIH